MSQLIHVVRSPWLLHACCPISCIGWNHVTHHSPAVPMEAFRLVSELHRICWIRLQGWSWDTTAAATLLASWCYFCPAFHSIPFSSTACMCANLLVQACIIWLRCRFSDLIDFAKVIHIISRQMLITSNDKPEWLSGNKMINGRVM